MEYRGFSYYNDFIHPRLMIRFRWTHYGLYFFLALALAWGGFLYFYPLEARFLNSINPSLRLFDRNGVLLYETSSPDQGKTELAPFASFPPSLIQATLAYEDANFYSHGGIDFLATLRALFQNLTAGRVVSGGSTLTQQLVRNVIGIDRPRTVFQKIKEAMIALRAERVFTKEELLTLYFNKIYYGHRNYGAASAARDYFGKNVSDLDLAESAFLAALPRSPNRTNPFADPMGALERKNHVLQRMAEEGFISDEETREAMDQPLTFQSKSVPIRAPHFVQMALQELEARFGERAFHEGWSVTTTLDVHFYDRIQALAKRHVERLADRNVSNAAVVTLDNATGDILALLGSVDYFNESIDGQVNNATALHQPGSAIKPITYATAFEKGWSGETLIDDTPVRFFTAEGFPYFPQNYDYDFHGTVTAREALGNSYNIPAVKAIDFAGVPAVLQKARDLGLKTLNQPPDHYGLALTLGDGEVRLLDLVNAYRAFARRGLYSKPRSILFVRDSRENTLFTAPESPSQPVVSEAASLLITDILADNDARLAQFGPTSPLQLQRPAAAKTGTTRSFRDNWTVGFTPELATGVWVGNADNSPMQEMTGVTGAAPLWRDVMNELHAGKPATPFPPPPAEDGWIRDSRPAAVPVRIVSPFDRDVFLFDSNRSPESQAITLRAEKQSAQDVVRWTVNGESAGQGDSVLWPIRVGDFEIQASANSALSAPVRIRVQ